MITPRQFLLTLAASLLGSAAFAQQNFPSRPLRMVIPWPPGQATDLVGRVIAQRLGEVLGQQVIADNRPGAGGAIGTDIVAKATPDGYTLLAASSGPVTISPLLLKVPYNLSVIWRRLPTPDFHLTCWWRKRRFQQRTRVNSSR
jgi:tripartite-type tricarboxylate transporter receptor subunit TctC